MSDPNQPKRHWFMVDVETDGPIPGDYSMLSFAVASVANPREFFYTDIIKPISENFDPEALKVNKIDRQDALVNGGDPLATMETLEAWLRRYDGKPMFISDNNGFDYMFMAWYFHHFLKRNPFGHSSTNMGSLYKGFVKNMRVNFKHLRRTKHTHNPVDDCVGNVEALRHMIYGADGIGGFSDG